MEFDNEKLKKYVDDSGLKKQKLADYLGITTTSLKRKMDGKSVWTLTELQELKKLIPSDKEFLSIFFKK